MYKAPKPVPTEAQLQREIRAIEREYTNVHYMPGRIRYKLTCLRRQVKALRYNSMRKSYGIAKYEGRV